MEEYADLRETRDGLWNSTGQGHAIKRASAEVSGGSIVFLVETEESRTPPERRTHDMCLL